MIINTLSKMKGKLVATALILAITLLTACSIVDSATQQVRSAIKLSPCQLPAMPPATRRARTK